MRITNPKIVYGELLQFNTFADLPDVVENSGRSVLVLNTTGIIGVRKLSGTYYSDGATWRRLSKNQLKSYDSDKLDGKDSEKFISEWVSEETTEINTIKFYQGNVYKNLTGTNTDDNPENDTTNWDVVTGGGVQAGFTQKFSVFSTDNLILFSVYEKDSEWKVQKTTSDSDTETALQTTTAPNESDADILTTLQNLTYI